MGGQQNGQKYTIETMKNILYENESDMLVYDNESHDLVWIKDDTINHIEATESLFERFRIISYFGEFLPVEALGIVVAKVKGQI